MKVPKFLMTAALAAVSLAAYADKTEITYMAWYNNTESEGQSIQATIDKFNDGNDHIHVKLIIVPRDGYETKVNTMAAGK
jgi:multiple sugar transport system substrate-binding protein